VTAYGDLGDASSAMWLFAMLAPRTTRTWNVLLGTLAKVAERTNSYNISPQQSAAATMIQIDQTRQESDMEFTSLKADRNLFDIVHMLLKAMCNQEEIDGVRAPQADSQTFCVAASALQYSPSTGSILANEIFMEASKLHIPADGRFINAALRCFGTDIDAALVSWKYTIRPKCISFEKRVISHSSSRKNLVAAYNGLLYVCGRALRPDIALRVIYAMNRDGIEPNETSLNSYRSGSRIHNNSHKKTNAASSNNNSDSLVTSVTSSIRTRIEQKLRLIDQFEALLVVECTKYDQNDKRRDGEQRVRIIL
jgi:pentatricopeptide repeat protein